MNDKPRGCCRVAFLFIVFISNMFFSWSNILYFLLSLIPQFPSQIIYSYTPVSVIFRKGLLKCPFSVPLWLLYVRLEKEHTSLMKARSLLEIARQKCPQSEDLWIESIRMERQAGNDALSKQLLAKARQTIPSSGKYLPH